MPAGLSTDDGNAGIAIRGETRMTALTHLSAVELSDGMASGEFSAADVIDAVLQRIAAREPEIHAWEFLDADLVWRQVKELGKRQPEKLLYGIPVGIKDISDTIDMPTTYGSPIYRDHQPASDAAYVRRLREAGAILIGKTVTTEFAYFEPGPTANPLNPAHTPGGSSSGSAAAVADFMVPVAFGTQVAGSLARPAAYCGLLGYKASFGLHSPEGLKGFSHSLGTLGWMTRTADDVALVHAALTASPFSRMDTGSIDKPRIALCKTYEWPHARAETVDAIESAKQNWSVNGAMVTEVTLPGPFENLLEAQKVIMAYEAAQELGHELHHHAGPLSPTLLELLEFGRQCTCSDYISAQELAGDCRNSLASIMSDYDALLTPSAPGEAPHGLQATGDPVFTRIWTLLHVPTINIPGYVGPNGLPVGVQLVGKMFGDRELFRIAKWCHENIAK